VPDGHVPRALRDRPSSGLDRALERDDARPEDEDRPASPDLHRPDRAQVRPDRGAELSQLDPDGAGEAGEVAGGGEDSRARRQLPAVAADAPPDHRLRPARPPDAPDPPPP